MKQNDDDARGGRRRQLDARQCELLIGLACKGQKPSLAAPATRSPEPIASSETKADRAQRDSLAEAMVGLILGPDGF